MCQVIAFCCSPIKRFVSSLWAKCIPKCHFCQQSIDYKSFPLELGSFFPGLILIPRSLSRFFRETMLLFFFIFLWNVIINVLAPQEDMSLVFCLYPLLYPFICHLNSLRCLLALAGKLHATAQTRCMPLNQMHPRVGPSLGQLLFL